VISGSKKCNPDYLLKMIEIAVSTLKDKKNIKRKGNIPVPNRLSKYHIVKNDLSMKQKLIYAAKLKREFGDFKDYTFDFSLIGILFNWESATDLKKFLNT